MQHVSGILILEAVCFLIAGFLIAEVSRIRTYSYAIAASFATGALVLLVIPLFAKSAIADMSLKEVFLELMRSWSHMMIPPLAYVFASLFGHGWASEELWPMQA
jgi:hypothetical protein